jgi:regulator of sigma E protease
MDTLLGIILVLGLMILVHEWGHFIVARWVGVRVDVFSIGFGPRLFGWKRGATDYRISALPLGGYVRMAGQELTDIDAGQQGPTGSPDELMSKARWKRALIMFGGPAMNLMMPILLLTGFYAIRGYPYQAYLDKPVIFSDLPASGPLAQKGVTDGDQLVAINSVSTPDWNQAYSALAQIPSGSNFSVTVSRHGVQQVVEIKNSDLQPDQKVLGYPPVPAVIGQVASGMPARRAGLQRGDVIVGINGTPVRNWLQCVDLIKASAGKLLKVDVRRNGKMVALEIQPAQQKDEDGHLAWKIGAGNEGQWAYRRMNLLTSLKESSLGTVDVTWKVIGVVGKLFSGKMSVSQLMGPVGIADMAGQAVQEGAFAVVSLMAVISLELGILNLLPIPILDGGHLFLLTVEGIRRKDLSLAFKERFIQVGFVFILVLFSIVMYHDILRLLPVRS